MKKQPINTFEEAVAYLYDVPKFTKKNTLEDTKAYLHRLGDPDKKMKIIHVAGTNGKGSVCAYMRNILEASGKRVAVFTSPHLVDIRERFLVNGQMIEKQIFLDAFLQIYNGLDWEGTYHPTFFEYLFLMAMVIFVQEDIDFCILETGLGGRLDATNAVSHKELAVITRISLDHVEYLGNTIAQIAGEKAGIMQADTLAVFTDGEPQATSIFVERAAQLGISAQGVSKNDYAFLNFKNKTIDFSVRTRYYDYISLSLHTIARYQMENCALAVRAIEALDKGRTITAEDIRRGVSACSWAGRMEEILPEVYVDGAHNEDGIRAFLDTVREDGLQNAETADREGAEGRFLLFSVVSDKDYAPMIRQIADSGLFQQIAIAHMSTGRAASLERLEQLFAEYPSCHYRLYTKVDAALQALLALRKDGERIYIAGSLYLVGEIKESLDHDQF